MSVAFQGCSFQHWIPRAQPRGGCVFALLADIGGYSSAFLNTVMAVQIFQRRAERCDALFLGA